MISNSYIGSSGQLWKLWIALGMLLIGFLALSGAFLPSVRNHETMPVVLIFGGLGLAVASFLWACFGVRCKKCLVPLVWKAMKEQSHSNWLNYVLTNKDCPYCRDQPEESVGK